MKDDQIITPGTKVMKRDTLILRNSLNINTSLKKHGYVACIAEPNRSSSQPTVKMTLVT